jgi:hypothetical protein
VGLYVALVFIMVENHSPFLNTEQKFFLEGDSCLI